MLKKDPGVDLSTIILHRGKSANMESRKRESCVCVCMCVNVYTSVCMNMCLCKNICVCMYVWVHVYMSMSMLEKCQTKKLIPQVKWPVNLTHVCWFDAWWQPFIPNRSVFLFSYFPSASPTRWTWREQASWKHRRQLPAWGRDGQNHLQLGSWVRMHWHVPVHSVSLSYCMVVMRIYCPGPSLITGHSDLPGSLKNVESRCYYWEKQRL